MLSQPEIERHGIPDAAEYMRTVLAERRSGVRGHYCAWVFRRKPCGARPTVGSDYCKKHLALMERNAEVKPGDPDGPSLRPAVRGGNAPF